MAANPEYREDPHTLGGALMRAIIEGGINPDPDTWALVSERQFEKAIGSLAWRAFVSMDSETREHLEWLGRCAASARKQR